MGHDELVNHMTELDAFKLGFYERFSSNGDFGRTWPDDHDLNEAYDRGMNFAEELLCSAP